MKVLFQSHGLITDQYKNFFQNNLPETIELSFGQTHDPDELADQISDVSVYVGYTISEQLLRNAESLKLIQVPWTGFDRMETKLLQDYPGIVVANSHANSLAIAEHAVALLFSTAKLIVLRDRYMREHDWSVRADDVNSFWLSGKRLGILGYGAIGQKVAKMMKLGFDMEVHAVNRHGGEPDQYCDWLSTVDELEEMLPNIDFLLVAVPLTDETRGMIGEKELSLLHHEVLVVNIARGPVIDQAALYHALEEHRIGGAGLDVWYNYPSRDRLVVEQDFPFADLDNIVMSPHSAFKIRDRVEVFAQDILENIKRVYRGEEPINQVYLDLGY